MNLPITSLIGLGLISGCMLLILLDVDRRFTLLAFCGVYAGGILMLIRISSWQILASLFLNAITAATLLETGHFDLKAPLPRGIINAQRIQRLLLGLVLWMLVYSFESRIAVWIPIPDSTLFAALYCCCCAILDLALKKELSDTFIDLLIIFFSFELIYMLVEGSVLVFGLMTAISLLIAFFGALINLNASDSEKWENLS